VAYIAPSIFVFVPHPSLYTHNSNRNPQPSWYHHTLGLLVFVLVSTWTFHLHYLRTTVYRTTYYWLWLWTLTSEASRKTSSLKVCAGKLAAHHSLQVFLPANRFRTEAAPCIATCNVVWGVTQPLPLLGTCPMAGLDSAARSSHPLVPTSYCVRVVEEWQNTPSFDLYRLIWWEKKLLRLKSPWRNS
jgi:hypothetical protein